MKKACVFLFIAAAAMLMHGMPAHAQDPPDPPTTPTDSVPDFDDWTDEQIKQWEDSVILALRPQPAAGVTTPSPSTKKLNRTKRDLSPFSFTNNSINNSYDIDRTRAVGEISVSSSVSPSGAVTYSVPVEVYPGVRGFQPQLSIAYSSQAGDGILGAGWSLAGLSGISRTGKSIYYDGTVQGLSMTKSDAFVLDGSRLIKLSETSSQIQYETEQGLVKVNAILSGNTVRYFEVYYPNGNKGVFGDVNNYNVNYLTYPVTSLSDIKGNTINFSYDYSNNRYKITGITWNGASVKFHYSTRSYPLAVYQAGMKITEDQELQRIECKFGDTALRSYKFTYRTQQYASLLTQIECIAGGSSLNPLKFFYGEGNTAGSYEKTKMKLHKWYPNDKPVKMKVVKGKFEYGSTDDGLISVVENFPYWEHYIHHTRLRHTQNSYDNCYKGNEEIHLYASLNADVAYPMAKLTTEKGFVDIFCANIDGKQEEEVVKVNNYVSTIGGREYDFLSFKVYSAKASNALTPRYTRTFNFSTVHTDNNNGKSIRPKFYFPGDFNGDGKIEVLAVSTHNPFGDPIASVCYLFDLEAGRKLYEGHAFDFKKSFAGTRQDKEDVAYRNSDKLYVLDYNGDGKTDICLINDNGTYFYTFDVSGSSYSIRQAAYYPGLKRSDLADRDLMIGEFNGDGLPDFLLTPKVNSSDWAIFYATGNGQFEKKAVSLAARTADATYLLQDINSDGLTDLIAYNKSNFYTYLAGNGEFSYNTAISSFNTEGAMIIPTDINSRNCFLPLIAIKNGDVTKFSYRRNDTKEKLLTGMVNSLGAVTKNYYRMLNESSGCYKKGSGAAFPYDNFQGPLYVAAATELYVGGQKKEFITHTYGNAVIHRQGLGFRGFEKVMAKDEIRSRTATQEYDPFNFGVLKSEESPVAKNTSTYSVNVQANRIAKITLSRRSSLDKLKNQTTDCSYQYDSYGNPTQETVNYGGGISTAATIQYSNTTELTGYYLGFPTDRTETVTRNGESFSKRMQVTSYTQGFPNTIIYSVNGNRKKEENFTYDSHGNVTKNAVKSYSAPDFLNTLYEYDSYGRIIKETGLLDFSTSFEYNGTTGSLDAKKNRKGQATNFKYDAFGRTVSITHPEGTEEKTSLSWSTSGMAGLYCVTATATGSPTGRTYYDARGMEIRSSRTRFDGKEGHTDRVYDSYGRLQKVSLPFTGTQPSHWNEYTYDSYDRPTLIKQASGKSVSYSYSGNSTTVVKEGISSTQTFDMQGNMISVLDPAGTTVYNLRPDGQPASIVAPGNVTTSFRYDGYGRQTGITDPSAGIQSYQYDASGNIFRETDATGKVTDFKYDSFNRLTDKSCPEFSTTWNYNSEALLSSVSSTNGTSTGYTYDTFDRVYTVRENAVDGKWLQKTFNYSGGNISFVKYESQTGSIVTENYVYNNGSLSEIKLNNQTTVWKLNAENDLGQPTDIKTGNISRTYGYDAYGLPTSRTAGSFQNFTYLFDASKGNLTYRRDNATGIQEDFTYDNLNRLENYGGVKAGYDIKGNITQKPDIGASFLYSIPDKPYALSGISAAGNAIPQRNQSVAYTSFKRPGIITEGNYSASFVYNDGGSRVKMEVRKNGARELSRYYLGGRYELDEGNAGTKEKLYLGGDYYSAFAVYVREGSGNWQVYNICRDYLGSITHITNSSGSVVQQLSYDAWGRLRNPANQQAYAPDTEPALFLGRGYTGHEHLAMFGLVNMNARLYDPAVGRFLSPDPYVQAPGFSQSYNRYAYCLNNPLKYIDENGEFFFLIPHIGWSKSGGLSIGLTATVGIPGIISAQAGIGYSFKSNDFSVTVGATAAFNTVYASYSTQSGFSVGWSVGISPQMGFPISTNFTSAGVNYNFKNESWSGNISAWGVDKSGWTFNPSISATFLEEQTTNLVRKQGFRSNNQVLKRFVANENYQGALDYFGFKGTYDPNNKFFNGGDDPGVTDVNTGSIYYNKTAFDGGFDKLHFVADHEAKHRANILSGKYKNVEITDKIKAQEEYNTYVYNYERQGLYPKHGRDLGSYINAYGTTANIDPDIAFKYNFDSPWWHFIYKIPRRW